MPRFHPKRCSARLQTPINPTTVADITAASFLVPAMGRLSFFLSNHKETPIRTKQMAVFAVILTGVASHVLKVVM
jgi:hypothetical protein